MSEIASTAYKNVQLRHFTLTTGLKKPSTMMWKENTKSFLIKRLID